MGTAVAFALGTYLFQGEIVSIGTVFLIYNYTTMLGRPMDNITHQVEQLQRAGAGISRIQELFRITSKVNHFRGEKVEKQEHSNFLHINEFDKNLPLGLTFNAITFGYDDSISVETQRDTNNSADSPVLKDITFSLRPGRALGLIGKTGSGKTTLSRLIFRFYDPQQGSIMMGPFIKGEMVDIRRIPLKALRNKIGLVTQNIQLFNASVRDNLTFFDDSIEDSTIINVIDTLGLISWYNSLPDGLNTILESGGTGLSAGEAQLLAFTRIFLANPSIVVLDEASSRLDPATETLIENAVDRLIHGRTAIIIAHHLETLQKTDEIMILEDGSILEYGDRICLMNDPNSKISTLLKMGLDEVLI